MTIDLKVMVTGIAEADCGLRIADYRGRGSKCKNNQHEKNVVLPESISKLFPEMQALTTLIIGPAPNNY